MSKAQIYVGNKNIAFYISAIAIQEKKGAEEIEILARGKQIRKAFDLANIVCRDFGFKKKDISFGSSEIEDKESKKKFYISDVKIELVKEK